MTSTFKHPLARKARLATTRLRDGGEQTALVIVTTLELDPAAKGFSRRNVDRLNAAAKAYVDETPGLAGYIVVNRPKDWDA